MRGSRHSYEEHQYEEYEDADVIVSSNSVLSVIVFGAMLLVGALIVYAMWQA